MAAITFTPKKGAAEETSEVAATPETKVAAVEPEQTVVVREAAPAVPYTIAAAGGPVDRSDIILPRINLTQKSGKLGDNFGPGSFLFEKKVVLAKPGMEFTATVLDIHKFFQEKVDFDGDEFGRRVGSPEEVDALGGTTNYNLKDTMPYFQNAADIIFVIKAPEEASEEDREMFPFEHGDGRYALAVYTVAGTGFTSLAKRILTDRVYTLKSGLHLGEYRIKSFLKEGAKFSWYIPEPSMPKKINDASKVAFYAELKSI